MISMYLLFRVIFKKSVSVVSLILEKATPSDSTSLPRGGVVCVIMVGGLMLFQFLMSSDI